MRCRRFLDVDLAAYFDPHVRRHHGDLEDHCAACAECAAELRAWTVLRRCLSDPPCPPGRHPAETVLARFTDPRAPMSAAQRVDLIDHLLRCPSCRDEVRVLQRLDQEQSPLFPSPPTVCDFRHRPPRRGS